MFDRIMCVLVRIKVRGKPCDVYHTVHESHKRAFLDISILSVTLNGEKTYLYCWERSNNGSILSKITLLGHINYFQSILSEDD